jgi:acyl-CoA thioesterase FadM
VTLAAPDGRVVAELELVVAAIDGKGGSSRPLTERERAALSAT